MMKKKDKDAIDFFKEKKEVLKVLDSGYSQGKNVKNLKKFLEIH